MWTYLGEAKRGNLAARLPLNSMFMCHAQLTHKDPTSIVWKEKSSMICDLSQKNHIKSGDIKDPSCLRPELSQVVKLHSQIELPVNASPQTNQFHQQRPHGWD